MIINGVTLIDIDIADADVAENYEEAMSMLSKATQYNESATRSQVIRQCCNAVFSMFDKIFGCGTAQKVFGGKTNLNICLKAVDDLVTQVNELEAANTKSIMALTNK